MNIPFRPASLVAGALLMIGASVGAAEAMPVAPLGAQGAGLEQAAYLHRHYPGYHSRAARRYRHARRNAPNRYCQNMPSRCR